MTMVLLREVLLLFCHILLTVQSLQLTLKPISDAPSSSKTSSPWTEIPINDPGKADVYFSQQDTIIGDRIKSGESVLLLNNISSQDECQFLINLATKSAKRHQEKRTEGGLDKPGLVRLPTWAAAQRAAKTKTPCADSICKQANEICRSILLRAFQKIDQEQPPLVSTLFGEGKSLADAFLQDDLDWSSREPAVNVYTKGGEFVAHKDAQSLTLLVALTGPTSFGGGGTSFWSQDSRGHRVEEPQLVLKPEAGTGILFGGCVTHSGIALTSGTRVVLVASCSPKSTQLQRAEAFAEQRDIYGDSL